MAVLSQITREDVLAALADLDAGAHADFGPSRHYDLEWNGRRYPPKAVVGLAARRSLGRRLRWDEFNGGEGPGGANHVLRRLGFTIVVKGGHPVERPRETVRASGSSDGRSTNRGRPPILIEWDGERVPRRDVMRKLAAEGRTISEIARLLDIPYHVAYVTLRGGSHQVSDTQGPRPSPTGADIILVGCVSQKQSTEAPAKDLYTSALFRRRRAYAEASQQPWWIVSAEYGLVVPERVIPPYDRRIGALPASRRIALGEAIAQGLEEAVGPLKGRHIELHAGHDYAAVVTRPLERLGAVVERPLANLRIGEQLSWYGDHAANVGDAEGRAGPVPAPTDYVGDGRGLGREITQEFLAGRLDLSLRSGAPTPGWKGMPEMQAVERLRDLGAAPHEVRLFLTFNAAMDRARDADRLAVAAAAMWRNARWTFDPESILRRSVRDLSDALRRTRVSQRHSVDAFAWRLLAETLADYRLAPHTHEVVYDGRGDARQLSTELAGATADGSPLFPLLSGPKIGPLWIRLMAHPGGAAVSSLETVPVAVDVQVRKVTEYLAVTDTGGLPLEDVRAAIQATWAKDVERHGAVGPGQLRGTPAALDPALWFYAKWGCTFCERAGRKIPISPICEGCRFPATR